MPLVGCCVYDLKRTQQRRRVERTGQGLEQAPVDVSRLGQHLCVHAKYGQALFNVSFHGLTVILGLASIYFWGHSVISTVRALCELPTAVLVPYRTILYSHKLESLDHKILALEAQALKLVE